MKRIEWVYLIAVATLAIAFGTTSVTEALRGIARGFGGEEIVPGVAGKPRDVDVDLLRRRMEEGSLSEKEALFYTDAPAVPPRAGRIPEEESRDPLAVSREVRVMGTEGRVTVRMPRHLGETEKTLEAAEGLLREIDCIMSSYAEDSEVSRLNAAPAGPFQVSGETLLVLAAARWFHEETGGAFDVTCRPLIELWEEAGAENRLPEPKEVEEARARSGWSGLTLNRGFVVKGREGVRVDLGGIAKGFAIDRTTEELKIAGSEGGMVEVGGDLRCFGRPPEGNLWKVAVRHPFKPGEACAEIAIEPGAVCTSGDYQRFFEIQGKRYSHIIDPRTGRPAEAAASVTVVAPMAMIADAWATALSVLGPSGFDLLPADGSVQALIVLGPPESPEIRMTPAFRALLTRGPSF